MAPFAIVKNRHNINRTLNSNCVIIFERVHKSMRKHSRSLAHIHVQSKALSTYTLMILSTSTQHNLITRNSNNSERTEGILPHEVRREKKKWTFLNSNIIFVRISIKHYSFHLDSWATVTITWILLHTYFSIPKRYASHGYRRTINCKESKKTKCSC